MHGKNLSMISFGTWSFLSHQTAQLNMKLRQYQGMRKSNYKFVSFVVNLIRYCDVGKCINLPQFLFTDIISLFLLVLYEVCKQAKLSWASIVP
jgi:hypothetical protein